MHAAAPFNSMGQTKVPQRCTCLPLGSPIDFVQVINVVRGITPLRAAHVHNYLHGYLSVLGEEARESRNLIDGHNYESSAFFVLIY